MKYASQVANVEGLMNAVVQELKSHGVKAPKVKKLGSSKQDVKQPVKLFGTAVGLLPTVIVDENGVAVPRFLVDLLLAIEKDIAVEGLFRKAGSVVRQKDLRKNIENLQTWRGVQVHDIVSVMKQFLRELPEPLILSRYQDSLSKAQNLEDPGVRVYAIMLLCLLLPKENLDVMRFLMQFLHRVAANSHSNRMDAHNLAVVMTPNLTQLSEKLDKCNKTLMCQTGVVETLIVNADRIGMVPDLLVEQVELPLGHSDDELEKSGGAGLDTSQKRKKRNSLNGVLNNLRRRNMAQPKTPTSQNSASFTTVYATPTLSYDGYPVQRTAPKRRAEGEIDATPVKKSKREEFGLEVCYTPMPASPVIFDLRSPLPFATGFTNAASHLGTFSSGDGATTFKFTSNILPHQQMGPSGESDKIFSMLPGLDVLKTFFTPGWFVKK